MSTLYTIGFTRRSAEDFFTALRDAGVKKLIDVRLNNSSQLAGFTKKDDLEFFLAEICECPYEHRPQWSPTKELLDGYKKGKLEWENYEKQFSFLLKTEAHIDAVTLSEVDGACLLCSEPTPEHCHRRLVAEALKEQLPELEILHL